VTGKEKEKKKKKKKKEKKKKSSRGRYPSRVKAYGVGVVDFSHLLPPNSQHAVVLPSACPGNLICAARESRHEACAIGA
jgi:hypothetical protein